MSVLCGCEAISSPNVGSKLAFKFLLCLNWQGNVLLKTKGHMQVDTLHNCCWNKKVKQVLHLKVGMLVNST